MRGDEFDVLVIGEGLSGMTTAATACKHGAHVMLASKGPGNFVLGSACVDLNGLDRGILGFGKCGAQEVEEAIGFFVELTTAAGCTYEGGIRERRLVPTIMGTFAEVSLAPRSMWKGDPRGVGKAVVAGIKNVSTFDANFVSERLSVRSREIGLSTFYRGVVITLPQSRDQRWLTPLDLASEIDRSAACRQDLIAALKSVVQDADLLIIPGIFGLDSGNDDIRQFEHDIGCPICELPTLPPSIIGLRFWRRIESHLSACGAEICTGFLIQKLCIDGDRCTGAIFDTPGRPRIVHAGSVILASGKFSHLLEDIRGKEHVQGVTMRVSKELQPENSEGVVLAKNIFACGSILGKFESRYENAIDIVSGYRAGMLACQQGVHYAKP